MNDKELLKNCDYYSKLFKLDALPCINFLLDFDIRITALKNIFETSTPLVGDTINLIVTEYTVAAEEHDYLIQKQHRVLSMLFTRKMDLECITWHSSCIQSPRNMYLAIDDLFDWQFALQTEIKIYESSILDWFDNYQDLHHLTKNNRKLRDMGMRLLTIPVQKMNIKFEKFKAKFPMIAVQFVSDQ